MEQPKPLCLSDELKMIHDYFFPRVVGEVNDVFVKLAKIKGEKIPWHDHRNEDEMFYVIKGKLWFEVENAEPFEMNEGEMFIVKKGVRHRVSSVEECHILLIENKTTEHTGEVMTEITRTVEEQIQQK